MTRMTCLCLIALLAACTTDPQGLTVDPAISGTGDSLADPGAVQDPDYDPSTDLSLTACGAHLVQDLVGTTLASAQATGRLPAEARIIRPGDVVTQDYSAQRMNVATTATTVIDRINCG